MTFRRIANALPTAGLTLAILGLMAGAGALVGGWLGALVALALALFASSAATRYADRIVLRAARARLLRPWEAPHLHALLSELAARSGIPTPRLWLVPSRRANAFAVGRDPATANVAVTVGLVEALDARGLAGVLAHEVAHIRYRDILLSSLAATVTAILASAGRWMLTITVLALPLFLLWAPKVLLATALLVMAPVAAVLLQAALSRQREFAADEEAARLTGDPLGLAAALDDIDATQRPLWWVLFGLRPAEDDHPLRSHPATPQRVERLLSMVGRRRAALV